MTTRVPDTENFHQGIHIPWSQTLTFHHIQFPEENFLHSKVFIF